MQLNITQPLEAITTSTAALNIEVELVGDGATALRVTRAGALLGEATEGLVDGARLTLPVVLTPGLNSLVVTTSDAEGEADRDVVVALYEAGDAPVITVDLAEDTVVFSAALALVGEVATDYEITLLEVSVGETTTVVETDEVGGFTAPLVLVAGTNTITVRATDSEGQSTTITRAVTLAVDVTAPRVVLDALRDNHAVRSRLLRVRGQVADEQEGIVVAVEHNGVEVPVVVDDEGGFVAELLLAAGDNSYTVRATDVADNAASETRHVYFGQRLGAGGSHSGAIVDGAYFAWGRNNIGQSGLGFTSLITDATHPTAAKPVAFAGEAVTPVSVALSQNASIVLDSTGHVWGFGDNTNGQLCLGVVGDVTEAGVEIVDTANRNAPTLVTAIDDVVAVYRGFSHTLLLKDDGTVWACGKNTNGQLGNGTTIASDVPVQVTGLTDIVHINAGSESSYAVGRDGVLHAWGRNQYGNLGGGSVDTTPHPVAVAVPGLASVVSVACGRDHVLALQDDGAVFAWGLNASNQVNAGEDDVASPVLVVDAAIAVYANGNQGFYEDGLGRLFGWGQNGSGNLGIPSDEDQAAPTVAVFGVENVVDAAIGALHGVALDKDGFIYSWGWSFQGSLGGGTSTINLWPYRIPILVEGVR